MRWIVRLTALATVLSIALFLAALSHRSFLEGSATESVERLEHYTSLLRLDAEQTIELTRLKRRLKGGEQYLANLQHRLWWIATGGFGGLTLLLGCITLISWRHRNTSAQSVTHDKSTRVQ